MGFDSGCGSAPVFLDCANGAGSVVAAPLQQLLLLFGDKQLHVRNTGEETEDCSSSSNGSSSSSSSKSSSCYSHAINDKCGSEFVQKEGRLPQRFGKQLLLLLLLLLLVLLLLSWLCLLLLLLLRLLPWLFLLLLSACGVCCWCILTDWQ